MYRFFLSQPPFHYFKVVLNSDLEVRHTHHFQFFSVFFNSFPWGNGVCRCSGIRFSIIILLTGLCAVLYNWPHSQPLNNIQQHSVSLELGFLDKILLSTFSKYEEEFYSYFDSCTPLRTMANVSNLPPLPYLLKKILCTIFNKNFSYTFFHFIL